MAQKNVTIRMDEDLKKQFDAFCSDIGMSMTTAFCVFAKTAVRERRIPFEISTENKRSTFTSDMPQYKQEVLDAMEEAKKISKDSSIKGYTDMNEMFRELNS